MIEITRPHLRLKPGDVLMVHRELTDKKSKEPYTWKFFAIVLRLLRAGVAVEILDERTDRKPMILGFSDPLVHIWYLSDEEWPDGVHAFRTKMILEGRLDEIV